MSSIPASFSLPSRVSADDRSLGVALIGAWRRDGFFYIQIDDRQRRLLAAAFDASRRFMAQTAEAKRHCINETSFSGYYVGNEYTIDAENNGRHIEAWETFNICKDLSLHEKRVAEHWPCHGPVPWPRRVPCYRDTMRAWIDELGCIGIRVVELIALGLGLVQQVISAMCRDGWHRMQTVHYPPRAPQNVGKGLSSHTDNGMLVLVAQDDVGGLHVRPPILGEPRLRNWLETESTAGMYEEVDPWHYVEPQRGMLVCFPGDTFQLLTDGFLLATPHKVSLSARERFSFAYFHEPRFDTMVRPIVNSEGHPLGANGVGGPQVGAELPSIGDKQQQQQQGIFYGRFFTSLWTRSYPQRPATRRILSDPKCMVKLAELEEVAMARDHAEEVVVKIMPAKRMLRLLGTGTTNWHKKCSKNE